MSNRYNFLYFEAEFKNYLLAGKAEPSTIKSYLSDLHYFFSWLSNVEHITEIESASLSDVFSHETIRRYNTFLVSETQSQNTAIRRIATLRKFFSLCIDQQWIRHNPAVDLSVATKADEKMALIHTYQKSLHAAQLSNIDIDRQIKVIKDFVCL